MNQTYAITINLIAAHKSVTRLQSKIPTRPQALIPSDQTLLTSSSQLLDILFTANNSEPTEPKTYKQVISNQKPKQQD